MSIVNSNNFLHKTVDGVKQFFSPLVNAATVVLKDGTRLEKDGVVSADKLQGKSWSEMMLEIYPVGRIYISVNETSPASLFGGTWEQIKDCFLLGAGGSYELGSTGGEATHKLTEDELPALRGSLNVHGGENGSNYWNPFGVFAGSQTVDKYIKVNGSTLKSAPSITGLDFSAGNDMPHNNMPPWKAVNIWKRVA